MVLLIFRGRVGTFHRRLHKMADYTYKNPTYKKINNEGEIWEEVIPIDLEEIEREERGFWDCLKECYS